LGGSVCNKSCKRKLTNTVRFFPQSTRRAQHARKKTMQLKSGVGTVKLTVWYGYDPGARQWGCPVRQRWGLSAHQQLSPALEDKLAFTLTATGSYAQAAVLCAKWGTPADDSTLHTLAQRLGARAEKQTQARLQTPAQEQEPQRAPTPLAVLQIDAWLVRHRGPGWGKKKTKKPRVAWHEMKMGVFYRHEQRACAQNGRGLLDDKAVVSWQGEALELGRRLHWQAQALGLGRAPNILALADGADWCWRLIGQRWPGARQLLDFYHASQHLWETARALCGGDEERARAWVEPRLHQLRHGKEKQLLQQLGAWARPRGEAGQIVRRNQNYFATHAGRLNYVEVARRGWPIGSGAVESACRSRQTRFKRPGQFWTHSGLRHLSALEEARTNGHWLQLWSHSQ
jgi:hypothetical protein